MLMAISIGVLFFIGVLGINVTMAMASRNSAQRAADSSALAGCLDLDGTFEATTTARQRAIDYAELASHNNTDGYTEGGNFGTAVNFAVSGNPEMLPDQWDRITVDVQRDQPFFAWVNFGAARRNVKARAACTRAVGSRPVLHSLSTGRDSFQMQGVELTLGRGGITVGAADCEGDRRMVVVGGGEIEARYVEVCSGASGIHTSDSASIDATIAQGSEADPYAGLAHPTLPALVDPPNSRLTMPGCTYPNGIGPTTPSPSNPQVCQIFTGSPNTPSVPDSVCPAPGTVVAYYGGLELGDGSSREITICPGIILYAASGGIRIRANTTVYGNGVLLFNGMNPHGRNRPAQICGSFHMEESSKLLITPPGPTPYDELVFFQQRDAMNCDAVATLEAGVTVGYEDEDGPWGSLYLATARISIGPQSLGQGGAESEYNVRIVAFEIYLTGPVTFNNIFIPSGTPEWGEVHLTE
jgi:hypothetical protein